MKKIFTTFADYLQRVFSIDLRALAFFRILMGGIIVAYAIPRLLNVYAFYSDWGILPRNDYYNLVNHFFWSFHLISGSTWVEILLILLQIFIALLLLIGYRSRLMTILSWIFLVSLQNRNPFVLNYGDQLFRMLLFWAMFLPLGAVWSLDNIWAEKKTNLVKSKDWFSVATVAILLQMVLFYVVNWFLKDSVEWKGVFALSHNWLDLFKFNQGFTATFYALNIGYLVTPIGRFLLNFPGLLKLATILYIFFELFGTLLLLSPYKTKYFRYISLAVFFTFVHGMLFLMFYTGLFQFFCVAGLSLFLPSDFWDFVEKKLFSPRRKLKIFYDQECELCTTGICIIKGSTGADQMIPLQSDAQFLELNQDISTIVVDDENGVRYTRVDAFVEVFKNSLFTSWLSFVLSIPLVHWVADKIYTVIANNRKYISGFIKFIKPKQSRQNKYLMLATQALAGVFLVMVVFWNYGNVVKKDYFTNPNLSQLMYVLRLDQYWGMFADKPTQQSVWLVVPGKLRDGTNVDVMNKTVGSVDFGRQDETPFRFWSQGWRNYFIDYPSHNNQNTALFAKYLCNDWNRYNSDYSKQLDNLTIYAVVQQTLLSGTSKPTTSFSQQYSCQ
jgi:predicted DCC family thiol-disulfide oxidoreductase YuxK